MHLCVIDLQIVLERNHQAEPNSLCALTNLILILRYSPSYKPTLIYPPDEYYPPLE